MRPASLAMFLPLPLLHVVAGVVFGAAQTDRFDGVGGDLDVMVSTCASFCGVFVVTAPFVRGFFIGHVRAPQLELVAYVASAICVDLACLYGASYLTIGSLTGDWMVTEHLTGWLLVTFDLQLLATMTALFFTRWLAPVPEVPVHAPTVLP